MNYKKYSKKSLKFSPYIITFLVLLIIGLSGFFILRTELLKNMQSTGSSLARNYALEEQNNLTIYETLISYVTENIDRQMAQGSSSEEIQEFMQAYFTGLQTVVGSDKIDPYAVIDNKIIAANPWENDDSYNYQASSWYQRAVSTKGNTVFTDIYIDAISDTGVITIARQCNNSDIVVAFDIFPENFRIEFDSANSIDNASFYLCDSNGTLIYYDSFLKDFSAKEIQGYINEIVAGINEGEFASFDTPVKDLNNERHNVYYYELNNGWTTIITVPYDIILSQLNDFTFVFGSVFLICLLVVVFIIWCNLRLNKEVERTNDTVRVLGNFYYALYRVDYANETYEMIKGSNYIRSRIAKKGPYDDLLKAISEVTEKNAYQEFLESFSINNIKKLVAKKMREYGGDFLRLFGDEYRWVNVRVLFDESLAPGEVVLCFREIEQEKQRAFQEQKLLENALESSKRSEQAKHAFFNNMSHDMRTPLNAIINLTQLALENSKDQEKTEDYLKKINYSSQTLLDLVNDILEMSRMEQGKIELNQEHFNLKECVSDCIEPFKLQAKQEDKNFKVSFDITDENVLGDSFRINQILNNLLSNAFKFTSKGDLISVAVKQIKQQGYSQFQFVIEDTGIGMSSQFLPHLFDPYARETRFSARQVDGTGLGMPIVKSLVTLMSGKIQVKSELDKGTIFTIVIPFTLADKQIEVKKETVEESLRFSLAGKKILLVEDNFINMEIATEILSNNGIEVVQAWNGQEAVDLFSQEAVGNFDAILMDMQMPVMDGCQATRIIRKMVRKDAKTIPIIAVTANAFAEDIAATTSAGMNGHISKPIDFDFLCKTLEKFLRQD